MPALLNSSVVAPALSLPFSLQDAAGQNTRTPYQFASIGSMSPTLWVARGYAVLDGPTLPIVAEVGQELGGMPEGVVSEGMVRKDLLRGNTVTNTRLGN